MIHDVRRREFTSLVDPDAPVRQIGTGFTFTEGPLWHPTEHYLLFSDMPGDVRRRWDEAGGVREVMRPSNKGNGMTYDADLNLVICEHATSSLVRLSPDGRREVLASHFEGQELNSPNDVCIRSDGTIYFSDPWFGRMPHYGVERPRELGWQGVFRVAPDGKLHLAADKRQFDQPNGLCFSPDESKLYVNDTHPDPHPGVRRRPRRLALARAALRPGHPVLARGRRPRRNEVRREGQHLGDRARRHPGVLAARGATRHGAHP